MDDFHIFYGPGQGRPLAGKYISPRKYISLAVEWSTAERNGKGETTGFDCGAGTVGETRSLTKNKMIRFYKESDWNYLCLSSYPFRRFISIYIIFVKEFTCIRRTII